MMTFIKKQGIAAWSVLAAAALGLVAVIIYLVNSTSGFMAGSELSGLIVAFSFIAIVLLIGAFAFSDKINGKFVDLALFVAAILLIVSFAIFILDRISLIADVYFIPVNFPASEKTSLMTAIVGFVFYALSVIAIIIGTCFNKMTKSNNA